jgi:RNA polymerase sigma factor (sigma-70 family)
MKTGLRKVLDHLRESLDPQGVTDAQLLKRFIADRDEEAFAAIVRRHGPMVLAVGRRILGNSHDIDDTFQASFFILAQKARSMLNRQAVGSWLYTVAYRTALAAKKRNIRRQRKEAQVENMPHPEVSAGEPPDWLPVLDHELNRLPEKHRAPLVLCDLESRPRREVARQLDISEGTLSSRLARGRRMLAQKLARHGIGLSAGALATALSSQAASASVSPCLISSTAKAAALVAAGQFATISTSISMLMKGALASMYLSKLKTFATVLVAVVLGAGTLFYSSGSAQAPAGKGKPRSDLEALREENELLKVNLRATLERIRSLEKQVATLEESKKGLRLTNSVIVDQMGYFGRQKAEADDRARAAEADAIAKKTIILLDQSQNLANILKELDPDAKTYPRDREALRRAAEILEDVARKLRKQEAAPEKAEKGKQ